MPSPDTALHTLAVAADHLSENNQGDQGMLMLGEQLSRLMPQLTSPPHGGCAAPEEGEDDIELAAVPAAAPAAVAPAAAAPAAESPASREWSSAAGVVSRRQRQLLACAWVRLG